MERTATEQRKRNQARGAMRSIGEIAARVLARLHVDEAGGDPPKPPPAEPATASHRRRGNGNADDTPAARPALVVW